MISIGTAFYRARDGVAQGSPQTVDAGLAVTKLGKSSVVYEIGLFRLDDDEPAALGRFVHVWVDRLSQRPVPIPGRIRAALEPLVVSREDAR